MIRAAGCACLPLLDAVCFPLVLVLSFWGDYGGVGFKSSFLLLLILCQYVSLQRHFNTKVQKLLKWTEYARQEIHTRCACYQPAPIHIDTQCLSYSKTWLTAEVRKRHATNSRCQVLLSELITASSSLPKLRKALLSVPLAVQLSWTISPSFYISYKDF